MMEKILPKWIDKSIWLWILLFVFFSPFSISLTQAVLSFALLFWLIKLFYTRTWQKTPLDLPIILFLSVGLVSAVLGTNPQRSFREILSEIFLVMIFFLMVNNLDYPKVQKLTRLLFIAVTITAFYGVIRFFVTHEERLRATKWYMTYGGYIMVATLFFLPSLLVSKQGDYRKYLKWVTFVLMIVALILTFTRGAWIGFIVGSLFIFWYYNRRWIKKFILCLVILLLCSFLLFPRARLTQRIYQIVEVDSWGRRTEMWLVALKIIQGHPVLGVGLDNYRYTVPGIFTRGRPQNNKFLSCA